MSPTDLEALAVQVREFEEKLPGWWFTMGTCSVSRDASCGPDRTGPDADLLQVKRFDEGFHCDDREGSIADALRTVMNEALEARAAYRGEKGVRRAARAARAEKTVRCFMDGIDWQHHLGNDRKGTPLFPSENSLLEGRTCIAEGGCGIVEVEVKLVRWVRKQTH